MTDAARRLSPGAGWLRLEQSGVPLLVVLLTVVAFAPALTADFVAWDDDTNFLRNPHYRGLGLDQLRWMWTTHLLGHYVPLSWMSLGVDYTLWGMDARGYHLTNLVIHAANALLLFLACRRVIPLALGERARSIDASAAIAALLYSIHPLRTESVVWITERRDVLSSFFFLLAVFAYLRSAAHGAFRRWYWLTIAAFLCAVFSKATAVTLPVVLLILGLYPLRLPRRRMMAELAPMFGLSLAAGLLSVVMLEPGPQLPFASKIAVSAYSMMFYIWKTLAPTSLAPLYEMPATIRLAAPKFVAGYVTCALFLGVWIAAVRSRRGLAAALAAFAVMIFPLLGVVQNGVQIAADRYTYQALQPIAVLIAAGLSLHWRRTFAAVGALLILVFGALTWRQSTYWKDSETLWRRVLAVDPNSSIARTALGNLLASENRLDEAVDEYTRSLAIRPGSDEAENNLGLTLTRLGRFDEAIMHYQRALDANPNKYEAHNNRGSLLARRGDLDGAIEHYRRALAIKSDFPDAEVNWGNALLRLGRPADAVGHYARAIAISPIAPGAEYNWGVALAQQGKFADAVPHFRSALQKDPGDAAAAAALATAERLAQRGK